MEVEPLKNKRIAEYLAQGKRPDGREVLEYRELDIELGVSTKAEGSARVTLGQTEVVAGVKLDLAEPYTDSPDEGALITTAELLPLSSERFEPGPPRVESIELSRIIDRSIRESGFLQLKKLCIKKGEKVWGVFLDIYPINDAGNLIDASVIAVVAALTDAVFPALAKEKVKYGELTTKALPLSDELPLTLTFHKIGNSLILDPTTEEEDVSEARLSLAISGEKVQSINAIQKGGLSALTTDEVSKIIDLGIKRWKKLHSSFKAGFDKAKKFKKLKAKKR